MIAHMSAHGPKRRSRNVCSRAAIEGSADLPVSINGDLSRRMSPNLRTRIAVSILAIFVLVAQQERLRFLGQKFD